MYKCINMFMFFFIYSNYYIKIRTNTIIYMKLNSKINWMISASISTVLYFNVLIYGYLLLDVYFCENLPYKFTKN